LGLNKEAKYTCLLEALVIAQIAGAIAALFAHCIPFNVGRYLFVAKVGVRLTAPNNCHRKMQKINFSKIIKKL
jgi:hypothetical protein